MSGGVLMTVDPKLPVDRQKAMLAQAKAKMVISLDEASPLGDAGVRMILVDPSSGRIVRGGHVATAPEPLPALSPWAPAYIFFTSGSTGVPKAVLGCHAGLAHFLDWQRKTFGVRRDDRAAQTTALSFDMLLRDIFLALTTGATLCIPAEGDTLDPMAILSWMAAEKITILHIVPTLLLAWVNNAPEGVTLPNLRLVFMAGEPVLDVLIKRFRERFGDTALLTNFYGPTETTLIKCFHPIRVIEPGPQPAGRPQPQTQVLILNKSRQLCGVNEPGEICIRTPFRTLGYLNAPEATAKVFVPNPFRDDPDDLIYRTGDKGRYRTDGLIEVQGRMDDQVKIRGVRVEPGEIEAVLATHPQVKQAAVVAHADEAGAKYLVGYVVLRSAASADTLALVRAFVRSKLPENMVPSELVALEAMPTLPNGKVNRKALRPPERTVVESPAAPATRGTGVAEQEAELLAIWRSVLGHSRVTVDDSFIELGGDSLSAMTVLVRMRRLGVPDAVARGIFQGWSIRQIVARSTGSASVGDVTQYKVRINQLVNATRGILVAIVVLSHWYEGLLNVLPARLRGLQTSLLPLLNIGTPGFALIFGLGTGYIFYPRFATDAPQVRRSMRLGFLLVAAGIVISAVVCLLRDVMDARSIDSTEFFNGFYSALLYYALALLTVPLWFRIMGGVHPIRRAAMMVLTAYLLHRLAQWTLADREQQGFLQLCRLMLVAKFNYFNMSIGALAGIGGGIYLSRWAAQNRSLRALAPRMGFAGVALLLAGVALTLLTFGNWDGINDTGSMPVSRWVFYAGMVLVVMCALALTLDRYERLPRPLREAVNVTAVLGQLSLPVFVLHRLVLQVKHLLAGFGIPKWPALGIPLVLFFGFLWWSMSKLYRLYYAKV
jgi:amino acid adenylation domain-containing protein